MVGKWFKTFLLEICFTYNIFFCICLWNFFSTSCRLLISKHKCFHWANYRIISFISIFCQWRIRLHHKHLMRSNVSKGSSGSDTLVSFVMVSQTSNGLAPICTSRWRFLILTFLVWQMLYMSPYEYTNQCYIVKRYNLDVKIPMFVSHRIQIQN